MEGLTPGVVCDIHSSHPLSNLHSRLPAVIPYRHRIVEDTHDDAAILGNVKAVDAKKAFSRRSGVLFTFHIDSLQHPVGCSKSGDVSHLLGSSLVSIIRLSGSSARITPAQDLNLPYTAHGFVFSSIHNTRRWCTWHPTFSASLCPLGL